MKLWSKRLIFAVAAMTVAWLTGIGFAMSGTSPNVPVTQPSDVQAPAHASGQVVVPGTAVPIAAAAAYQQAAGRAAQTPAPAGRAGQAGGGTAAPARGTTPPVSRVPAGQQASDQVFKNIQVLKGIPVDEFMG